jgi:CheY-like chemotaxis protein
MLRRLIGEDVELVTRLTSARATIRADAGQIEQVIVNLAVNARDAMPRGGILTIGLDELELDDAFAREHPGSRPGPHVRLSVADTGVGMDAEVLSHLFEPFFTTKEVGKGTGLGLATVYGIVKQSDGYIAVRSAPGKGTTFEVHFPHVPGSVRGPAEPGSDALPRGAETVLLVEDEEAVRKLLGQILTSAGYRVIDAGGGAEALERSRLHPGALDLMITDVVMPGLSGPQLAVRLAEERPGIRVLFISGHADGTLGAEAPLGPGRSFLYKPFTAGDLTRRVRQILDGPPGPSHRGS